MNFASIHKLPIVFFVENNKYAISVPMSRQMAIERYALRADGYAMPGVTVDGTDVRASYLTAAAAVQLAAMGGGPSVVEFDGSATSRIRATTTTASTGTAMR